MEQKNMYSDEYATATQPTLKELMARIVQLESKRATHKPQQKVLAKAKKPDLKEINFQKSVKFFEEKCKVSVVEKGFKIKMPVSAGEKSYDAVKFSNGRIGVILDSGIIKYAWA